MKKMKKHHVQHKIREINEKIRGIFRFSSRKILAKQKPQAMPPPFRIGPNPEVETPFSPPKLSQLQVVDLRFQGPSWQTKTVTNFKGESSASAACVKKFLNIPKNGRFFGGVKRCPFEILAKWNNISPSLDFPEIRTNSLPRIYLLGGFWSCFRSLKFEQIHISYNCLLKPKNALKPFPNSPENGCCSKPSGRSGSHPRSRTDLLGPPFLRRASRCASWLEVETMEPTY